MSAYREAYQEPTGPLHVSLAWMAGRTLLAVLLIAALGVETQRSRSREMRAAKLPRPHFSSAACLSDQRDLLHGAADAHAHGFRFAAAVGFDARRAVSDFGVWIQLAIEPR